ncbi:MAG: DNA/RNA nuclease SfsA [Nitriliruptoraceae bacterium]
MPERPSLVEARFLARENRFVVTAARDDGEVVRAYLPNTARLHDLLVPGARILLAPSADPSRRTRWTLTRVWDGTWVALVADAAADLLVHHLEAGEVVPGWPAVVDHRREVTSGRHRFDLELTLADGRRALVEVKSLSRARDRVAALSCTPSTRASSQLAELARSAATGVPAAVVFVVQRDDVDVLDLAAPADEAWRTAVRAARQAGVEVVAFACAVEEDRARISRTLAVHDQRPAPLADALGQVRTERSLAAAYAGSVIALHSAEVAPVTIEPVPDATGPGVLPEGLPPAARHLHIITACNPRSRLLSDEENAARNARLERELRDRGLEIITADGSAPDGSWQEPGFGIVDAEPAEVLALARRFEQLAVFELTPTELRVRWTEPDRPTIVQGWQRRPGTEPAA